MPYRYPSTAKRKKTAAKKSSKRSRTTVFKPSNLRAMQEECGEKYTQAVLNPWSPSARGACVPMPPAKPSQKAFARTRVTFVQPTKCWAGNHGDLVGVEDCVGFVVFLAPAICNDKRVIKIVPYGSTAPLNLADKGILFEAGAAGHQSVKSLDLPYKSTDFQKDVNGNPSGLNGRCVSSSLRIRYTGDEFSRAGSMYGLVASAHNTLEASTLNMLLSANETTQAPVKKEFFALGIAAQDDEEMSYNDGAKVGNAGTEVPVSLLYPFSNGYLAEDATEGGSPLAIIVTGAKSLASFEIEAITHCEYIGHRTQSAQTMNAASSKKAYQAQSALGRFGNHVGSAIKDVFIPKDQSDWGLAKRAFQITAGGVGLGAAAAGGFAEPFLQLM